MRKKKKKKQAQYCHTYLGNYIVRIKFFPK